MYKMTAQPPSLTLWGHHHPDSEVQVVTHCPKTCSNTAPVLPVPLPPSMSLNLWKMNFVPPPFPDDVEEDFGPYSRDEIVVARASLLHTVQRDTSMMWQTIKYKLGILPNGHRLRTFDPDHVWLPPDLPSLWSAPVSLHDPTTSEGAGDLDSEADRGDERREGKKGGEKKGRGERPPWGSGAQMIRVETSPPPGGMSASSRTPSGKRSWEHSQHDDGRPSASGDGGGDVDDDNDDTPTVHNDRAAEKRRVHTNSSKASDAEGSSGGGHSASKCRKLDKCPGGAEDQHYTVMYQCDLCASLSQHEVDMLHHLQQNGHYSASRYLAMRDQENGELHPVYLSVASFLKKYQHLFQDQVAACPICHSTFASVCQCMSHSLVRHKQYGLYSLRSVTKSVTFDLYQDMDRCVECGEELQNKDVAAHSKVTRHMAEYTGRKTAQPMMIFLCPYCLLTHVNYWLYKTHVFTKHTEHVRPSTVVNASCCMLGQSQPALTMLPKDPGIPMENIDYGFSMPLLPTDHGFQGAKTKSKTRRSAKKQRGHERRAAQRQGMTGSLSKGDNQASVSKKKKGKKKTRKKTGRL